MTCQLTRAVIGLTTIMLMAPSFAEEFEARLGRVPVDSRTQASIQGLGHATGELDGRRLSIDGEFSGLMGAATEANLHMGLAVGVRGPVIHALTVSRTADGELSGAVELSREQLDALRAGRLYIQVHSESAPDGNLWGWLLNE